jgi:hypothetical protein
MVPLLVFGMKASQMERTLALIYSSFRTGVYELLPHIVVVTPRAWAAAVPFLTGLEVTMKREHIWRPMASVIWRDPLDTSTTRSPGMPTSA